MGIRLLSRLGLATILLMPSIVAATPQTVPQAASAPRATSQWTISVNPVDSEHSRVTVNRGDSEIVCDAKSASISYTADGMVVDINGPGTMSVKGGKSTAFATVRVAFTNGKFSGLEVHGGASSR